MVLGLAFDAPGSLRDGVPVVVANFGPDSCHLTGVSGDENGLALMCTTQKRIDGLTEDRAGKLSSPERWLRGELLVVCLQLEVGVETGLVPLQTIESCARKAKYREDRFRTGGLETSASGAVWEWCGDGELHSRWSSCWAARHSEDRYNCISFVRLSTHAGYLSLFLCAISRALSASSVAMPAFPRVRLIEPGMILGASPCAPYAS